MNIDRLVLSDSTVPQRVRPRFLMARRIREFGQGAADGSGPRRRRRIGAPPPDPWP